MSTTHHTGATSSSASRPAVSPAASGIGGGAYLLGIIGALVFFWGQANSFLGYLAAIAKSLFWPAFLVYGAMRALFGA
ncbi:MAG TPA: hypothetical protein VFP34_19900 [Microlunatus sp.]|nr:hypothetical protein [Microlunatus sp.]